MARTRQEIINDLFEQASSDPILSSVSQSLVGKELTYFGGNVIYQIESMSDAISRYADIARADFQQLIAFAYTNDIPCDTVKPATVRISLNLSKIGVYPPFSIKLKVGAINFYNIDFVRSTDQITLYQGTPHAVVSGKVASSSSILDAFGMESQSDIPPTFYKSWRLYKEFKEGKYQSSYLKLGSLAFSDSVRVFARQTGTTSDLVVFPYTEFNQSLASPDAKLYKVRTGWDKSVNVLFGDTNWAMEVNQEEFQYEIYWLELGVANFNLSLSNELELGYSKQSTTITRDSSKGDYYTPLSFSQGEVNSLAYSKSFVLTKNFLQRGLVTEPQISAYVDSLPAVNSSRISSESEANTVTVIVKPSDPSDVYFGFLEDFLTQYGVDGTLYKVIVATPLDFNVEISALNQSGLSELSRAKQVISEYCSYENLTINTMVSTAILNQKLQQSGMFNVTATIVVKGEIVNPDINRVLKLQATPQINTIRQYSSEGQLVAFDSDGVYRQISRESGIPVDSDPMISVIGDFFYLCSKDSSGKIISFLLRKEEDRILAVDATKVIVDPEGNPVYGKFIEFYEDNVPFLRKNSDGFWEILRYAKSSAFEEGDTSIFNRMTTIRPTGPAESIQYSAPIVPTGTVALVNTYLFLSLNFGSESSPQYKTVKFIPTPDGWAQDSVVSQYQDTDIRRTYFGVYDKTLIIPTGFSSNNWTLYDAYDAVNGTLTVGKVTFQNGKTAIPQGLIFHGVSLFILNKSEKTTIQQCGYRFASNKSELQLILQREMPFDSESPSSLMKVDDSNNLYLTDDVFIWKTPIVNSTPALKISESYSFKSEGSVDYETGVIYGILEFSEKDTLNYVVAGTLRGSTVYPRYIPFNE